MPKWHCHAPRCRCRNREHYRRCPAFVALKLRERQARVGDRDSGREEPVFEKPDLECLPSLTANINFDRSGRCPTAKDVCEHPSIVSGQIELRAPVYRRITIYKAFSVAGDDSGG